MTIPAAYIIGGPGTGKSTLMAAVLEGLTFGPVVELHEKPNKKALVKLRGQHLYSPRNHSQTSVGVYLGINREHFPGADALDNASSPVGAEWVATGPYVGFIVGEGLALSTRPFMAALDHHTDLLLIHLQANPDTVAERFAARGSNQNPAWVAQATTRCANLSLFVAERGGRVLHCQNEDEDDLALLSDLIQRHLGLPIR